MNKEVYKSKKYDSKNVSRTGKTPRDSDTNSNMGGKSFFSTSASNSQDTSWILAQDTLQFNSVLTLYPEQCQVP